MANVNASRSKMARKVSDATDEACLIGFNDNGLACVWYGGYGFNVFDVARDWQEVDYFTSGELAGIAEKFDDERRKHAEWRMESEGYDVI